MKTPETSTVFAGIDGRTDATLPSWYEHKTGVDPTEVVTFAEAIRTLPQAVETTVAYRNPYTDTWVPTERFNALIEPTRALDDTTGEAVEDPLFYIPTSSYSIINPVDVYGPFETVVTTHDLDGRALGEVVFGEIRQYRSGGEVHMDLLFDGLEVSLPGRREPITMGVTSGYDFFGGNAVYVEGFAQDTLCSNSIRSLTDRQAIKHVGEIADFHDWWEEVLSRIELVADDLHAFILDASEISIDFTNVPFDVVEFYELLGFPEYLAQHAGSDARANAEDLFELDMWTLHSGATYALSHFYRGREGASLDAYVRVGNDLLFNPGAILEQVEREYARRAASDVHDGQTGLSSQVALAQLDRVNSDIRAKAASFRERESQLRERFTSVHSD